MWNKKYLLALPLVLLMLPAVVPRPQNPLEMGAMTIAGVLTEAVQGGGAMRKDIDMETPLFALRSKSEIGAGDAIRPRTNSDLDSDEDGRRRKRATKDNATWIWQPSSHRRNKRSPCIWNTAGGGGGNGNNGGGGNEDEDYTDPIESRRRKRAKQRKHTTRQSKRSSSSKTRKTKKTFGIDQDMHIKKRLWRTRRQIQGMTENMGVFGQNVGNNTPPKITDWVQGIWDSFVNTMTDVTQYMKQTISTAKKETFMQ